MTTTTRSPLADRSVRTGQTLRTDQPLRADQLDALRRLSDARARLLEATAVLNEARGDLEWAFRNAHRSGLADEDLSRVVVD